MKDISTYCKPKSVTDHLESVSSTPLISNCTTVSNSTPDTTLYKRKIKNVVSAEKEKKQTSCRYCQIHGNECHNDRYGTYLYRVCIDALKGDNYYGVKHDLETYENMFRQRYHVLAEFEAFKDHGDLELEYADEKKRELTECLKDGWYHKMRMDVGNGKF